VIDRLEGTGSVVRRSPRWAAWLTLCIAGCDGQLHGYPGDPDAQGPSSPDTGTELVDAGAAPGPGPVPGGPGPMADPGPDTAGLGAAPDGLEVRWPAPPAITRDVRVASAAELEGALRPGSRVTLAVSVPLLQIVVSDIELVVEDGVRVGELRIARELARIRVRGGSFGTIGIEIPGTYYPSEEWRAEWRTTDVLIDDVDVEAADTAFMLRGGVRVAVTNSRAHAVRYGLWVGDTADFESEDVIVAGNRIVADGPEATIRFVHVRRSAVVGNRLENTSKHNYRVHGRSEENWAARNLMVGTGIMIGTLPADEWAIQRQWVDANVLHHTTPSLLELDARTVGLVMRDNRVYTDVWDCFVCVGPQPSWVLENNVQAPYQPPPPAED